jgi:hypothetical protein
MRDDCRSEKDAPDRIPYARSQIGEVSVKVYLAGAPRHPVHPGGSIAFEREERFPKQGDVDVV